MLTNAPDKSVVIYRLGSLGDTLVALPCFHLIAQAFPDARRLVLTNQPVASNAAPLGVILGESGLIDGTIAYPVRLRSIAGLAGLWRDLRRVRADTLVYLTANRGALAVARDYAFFRLCGFRRVIGLPWTEDLRKNRTSAAGTLEPEARRLARTLAVLGEVDLDDPASWDLGLTSSERAAGDAAVHGLAPGRFIVVNTGGKAVEKDWGEARWTSLLKRLGERLPGYGLLFVGAREDADRAARLALGWRGLVVNACGALSPRQSAAAMTSAALFVGHDSGPLHLAAAVGLPCVGLFGDYNRPAMWHPVGARHHIIHEMRGVEAISEEQVMQAIDAALAWTAVRG